MKVCGVEIKGSEAIFAMVLRSDGVLSHLPIATKKIELEDDDESANVKAFAEQITAFVKANDIAHIAIKKRGKKGDFAGGPTTFKIEGIFQLLADCEVTLISAQTMSAQERKHGYELPASLNKYQHEAYRAACALILKAVK
ncbi:DUF3010 family protein [Chitinimonas naiadis]